MQISEPDPGGREEKGDLLDMSTKIAESGAAFQSEKMLTAPNDSYPICWFEDEDTNLPVRWHLFAGILFDFKKPNVSSGSSSNATLPWKLKLHFTNYPGFTQMILPLEHPVLTNVQASYKHSLKQAMTIASGNSRSAMNVTKESHGLLWEAVRLNSFVFYQRADVLPLSSTTKTVVAIPVRVLVNGSSPPMQQRVEGSETITLGELLNQWLPHLFADQTPPSNGLENGTDKDNADGDTAELGVTSTNTVLCWKVSGVQPPLSMSLMELWTKCAYPDQFLYVIVLTR